MIPFLKSIFQDIPFAVIWDIVKTVFPLKEVLTHVMGWLQAEAAKTNTKLDDDAVFAITAILEKAGLLDSPEVPTVPGK